MREPTGALPKPDDRAFILQFSNAKLVGMFFQGLLAALESDYEAT
ncbi:hypothetical protein [Moorena sp. SIO4G3]|nr:hypothetical protein [Moorena sp. SIO4G3]